MEGHSVSALDNPSFTGDSGDKYTNGVVTNGDSRDSNQNRYHANGDAPAKVKAAGGTAGGTTSETAAGSRYADIEDDVRCGYGSCKPDWLQVCNNPKMFLFLLCWFAFIQGFVINGINNVNTASVERRFKLASSQVGLISSSYDISAGIFVLPVTYFGTYAHQPRLIMIAALVMALGSFVMTIPHFTSGPYEFRSGAADVCNAQVNMSSVMCTPESDGLSNYLYVFMLGQFLHGFGGTVLYSIGIVFIDANVRTTDSPMYQGLLYSAAALGPAVGYLLGGYFLDTFVDFDTVDVSLLKITPQDVQWVGAWWIGFVISTCLLFFTVVFSMMPYARELPTAKKVAQYRTSQAHQDGAEQIASREKFGATLRDLPTSLLLLLRNPVLMLATAASVTEGIVTSGFATFLAKFIQNQYGKTAAESAILAGLVAVPGAAGGNALGGLITKCFSLKVRGMLRLNICLCLTVVAICGIFFAKCPVTQIAGVSVPYGSNEFSQKSVNLTAGCNAHCGCSTASYEPVCGDDKVQYFSPCHAGCNSSSMVDDVLTFQNCSCVLPDAQTPGATQRVCDEATCWLLNLFLPTFFFLICLTFMAAVPTVSITLRCIPDIQRSFAIGIQWLFVRFLGTVPGPILFGFVFDRACLLWQEKCGSQGSCWLYNNQQLSVNLAVLGMVIKAMSAFFYTMAYCAYKPPEEEEEHPVTNGVNGGTQNEGFSAETPEVDHRTMDYTGPAPRDMTTNL